MSNIENDWEQKPMPVRILQIPTEMQWSDLTQAQREQYILDMQGMGISVQYYNTLHGYIVVMSLAGHLQAYSDQELFNQLFRKRENENGNVNPEAG